MSIISHTLLQCPKTNVVIEVQHKLLQITCVKVPLFATFHFINAFEEKDGDGKVVEVIADCCELYADTTILDKLRLQQLRSFSGIDSLPHSRYMFS